MGISIKHNEYERLIRQLARERGTSLTEAIGLAVRHELARSDEETRKADFLDRVRRAQAMIAKAEIIDPRPYREILYDDDGLPH